MQGAYRTPAGQQEPGAEACRALAYDVVELAGGEAEVGDILKAAVSMLNVHAVVLGAGQGCGWG